MEPIGLLSPEQAAEYLGYTARFLAIRRMKGDGPKFVKISARAVRYRQADLDAWINERVVSSTKETCGEGDAEILVKSEDKILFSMEIPLPGKESEA